jgi:hypothetical protein
MTIFNNIHHANIPMSTKRHNTKHIPKSPRITNSLLQSINLKNRLFHKFLSKRNSTNHLAYTKKKNILTSVLRSAKKNYFFNQFEREKNNIKNTWKLINTVINKDVSQQKISGITHNGIYTENSSSISEHFNNYFANIGPSLASKIPPCNSNFMSYLGIPNPHSIFLDPVTTEEVCDVVANLANKKSSGSDSINAFVIKRVIPAIVIPLTFIVNQSFSLGIFSDTMKIAKVTPIHKNGAVDQVSNYRPTSVLTCFSKILERLAYTRISGFLQKHDILSNFQFGFRAKHSTTHAVIHLIDKVVTAIDNSEHTLGIFLDFSKAFDTLDHSILLQKLNHYGIRGRSLEWFTSYLSNRKQYVTVGGTLIHHPLNYMWCSSGLYSGTTSLLDLYQ